MADLFGTSTDPFVEILDLTYGFTRFLTTSPGVWVLGVLVVLSVLTVFIRSRG